MRETARQLARTLGQGITEGAANELALRALQQYKALAVQLGERHYVDRYDVALAGVEEQQPSPPT
jgi:hypothetical protein